MGSRPHDLVSFAEVEVGTQSLIFTQHEPCSSEQGDSEMPERLDSAEAQHGGGAQSPCVTPPRVFSACAEWKVGLREAAPPWMMVVFLF